jgi:hypothetical protein
MLETGQYVRHKMATRTRVGTVEGSEVRHGKLFYHFRQDQRLNEAVPGFEAYFSEEELEPCTRPSDEYWKLINELIEHGG